MSYCRFQNTLNDLRDCEDNMEQLEDEEEGSEYRCRKELVEACQRIVENYEHLLDE